MKIDTNVPVPSMKTNSFPIADMEPGDSLFLTEKNRIHTLRTVLYRYKKKTGTTWTSKREDGGIRFWRVS
jgi:hypothetical protein